MGEIPEDIMKTAWKWHSENFFSDHDSTTVIAMAIMAERERAAKIAADYECDITKDSMMGAPFAIATAIRNQSGN